MWFHLHQVSKASKSQEAKGRLMSDCEGLGVGRGEGTCSQVCFLSDDEGAVKLRAAMAAQVRMH